MEVCFISGVKLKLESAVSSTVCTIPIKSLVVNLAYDGK